MSKKLNNIKIWGLIWFFKTIYGYRNISVKVLFAQARHETGNFTSEVYEENNNLFGMREAKKRKRSVEGTKHGHAVYKNHTQSIIDYFLRQNYFEINKSNDASYMVSTVESGYATDTKYLPKWENLVSTTKTPIAVKLVMYGGLFFLAVILFLIYKKNKTK